MSSPLQQFKDWTHGDLVELGHKLGGPDTARQILSCSAVTVTFNDGKAKVVATDHVTSIWKTITIGNTPRDQFDQKLRDSGMEVNDLAPDMMKQDAFTVVEREEQIDLVNVSVGELGFEEATCYDVICARAKERGLELCPPEVGPQLRLQYLDQPKDEWVRVAMEDIRDSGGGLHVFRVGHDDDALWLRSLCYSDCLFDPDDRFVFRARKQPSDA